MTVAHLTDQIVEQLTCPPERAHWEVFDTKIKGLFVDVQPNGRMAWRLRWYERHNGKARKKLLTLGNAHVITVAEARLAAKEKLRMVWTGADPRAEALPGAGPMLRDFIAHQYLPYVKTYKLSWRTDESTMRHHLLPTLGHLPMGQITVPQMARLVQHLKDKALAPGTINKVLILTRYAYTLAMRWSVDGITCNPVKEIQNLKDDYKLERYLTPEQLQRLIAAVRCSDNAMLQHIVPFLVYTGARKREVLDARWADLDWRQKSWRIPKTKSGKVRHVPLSQAALDVLICLRPEAVPDGLRPAEFIFANPKTGLPFVSVFYSWSTARQQAGLPELRIHDLRHSFASFLVNAGRSLYEVQELLGHADIKTTSRYAHLSRERLMAAVEAVPKVV